jgi:uncharacterized protein (DUF4415 family)
MKMKSLKRKYEELVDDAPELEVEEEFRFNPVRAERLPRGVRKVRVNIYLDDDIVAYFQGRATEPNAAPHQAQINRTLRETMERERATRSTEQASSISDVRTLLLADKEFINALAKQVAQVSAKDKRRKAA